MPLSAHITFYFMIILQSILWSFFKKFTEMGLVHVTEVFGEVKFKQIANAQWKHYRQRCMTKHKARDQCVQVHDTFHLYELFTLYSPM